MEKKKINKENKYYIQNGYVGNSMYWWRKGGSGYTTNLDEAGIYDEQEAYDMIANSSRIEVAWPVDYIKEKATLHVDSQKVAKTYALRVPDFEK